MKPKAALLTGSLPRHKYIARSLSEQVDLVAVVIEKKRQPVAPGNMSDLVLQHISGWNRAEAHYFGSEPEFEATGAAILEIQNGEINGDVAYDFIQEQAPEYLFLYGTSIIGARLLNRYPDRVFNLHLGLSPYYKGAATNIWPLVNGEPECVGATFHLAIPAVDAGPVLFQLRPSSLAADDSAHDIGCKTILEAGRKVGEVIIRYHRGNLMPHKQQGEGKVYRRIDFTESSILSLQENIDALMVPRYLDNKPNRDRLFPIVSG